MRATCVDLTDVLGHGDARHLRPLRTRGRAAARADRPRDHGARLERRRLPVPRRLPRLPPPDRARPPAVGQRRLASTTPARAAAQARADAARLRRPRARRAGRRRPGGLRAGHRAARPLVVRGRRSGSRRSSTRPGGRASRSCRLDDALEDVEPAPPLPPSARVTTWGTPRDLSTWTRPAVADLAWQARAAELRVVAAGRAPGRGARARAAGAAEQRLGVPGDPRDGGRLPAASERPRTARALDEALALPAGLRPRAAPPRARPRPGSARVALKAFRSGTSLRSTRRLNRYTPSPEPQAARERGTQWARCSAAPGRIAGATPA